MSAAGAPIVEVRSLAKVFGGGRGLFARAPAVHAVHDVSFAVAPGETFAIVGESGCGKSTLGRLLLRLLEPTEGRVFFEGRDITHTHGAELRALRRDMQLIFQDPFSSLNPSMTVGQLIGEPIALHGLAPDRKALRERVAELLETVGLHAAYAERYPHEFSGGQRQRIGIARALAGEPRLLVGDEPVSALDVSVQAQVINLLEDLKHRLGLTLVIVAHDLAVIRHMSDRVAVMYLGEVVELGPVDAIFDAPLHPYTRSLLGAIPADSPHRRHTRILPLGELPSPTNPPSGCRFHPRCPHARAECSTTHPFRQKLDDGREVACLFWRDIQSAAPALPATSGASPALARRLALYQARRQPAGETPRAAAPSRQQPGVTP